MMNNFDEQDFWDDEVVEITDLGAPDRGFRRHLFLCGEKWLVATYFRVKFALFTCLISLLFAALQPSSSFVNDQTAGLHLSVTHSVHAHTLDFIHNYSYTSTLPGLQS